MAEENRKWNKEKMARAMKESKDEFAVLQFDLLNLMVKFSLRALKTFQAGKNEDLNPLQINEIVSREIESIIGDLSTPKFVDMIIKKTETDFYNGTSEPLKPSGHIE